ncbi:MAG: hypothetical protein LBR38_07925 [Synergistaceae bacterium]|jgi:hypothetical protein|nr:hypothetical protein [Synergistaceae bacterium]
MATDCVRETPSRKNYPFDEDELDRIRLDMYEKTKDMTPQERQAYIMAEAMPIIRQYGMRTMTIDEVRARGGFPPLGDVKPRGDDLSHGERVSL